MNDLNASCRAAVEKFFVLFDADDLDPFKSILHPDIEWTMMGSSIPGFGVAHKGADMIVDTVIAPARKQFAGRPVSTLKNMIVAAPWVVAEVEGSGVFRDGRPYENSYCIVFEIKCGLVRILREYMDTGYILELMRS